MLRILKSVLAALVALSPMVAAAAPANVSFSSPAAKSTAMTSSRSPQRFRHPMPITLSRMRRLQASSKPPTAPAAIRWKAFVIRRTAACSASDSWRLRPPITSTPSPTNRDGFEKTAQGTFRAVEAHKRGILRVDPGYPWHFIWEGTGEHYFFNGTTAYWLVGWRDERIIRIQRRSPASAESESSSRHHRRTRSNVTFR